MGGAATAGVAIEGNSISSNGGLASICIRTVSLRMTTWIPTQAPMGLQNFPLVTTATSDVDELTLSGTLNSNAALAYRVEFFASATADPSGNGEGQVYLGLTSVTTDAAGNASFNNVTLATPVAVGWVISATATSATNQTLEFALNRVVDIAPVLATGSVLVYTENQVATAINTVITVTDRLNATLASGTVSITANFVSGQDALGFTNVPATMGNIAGAYNAGTGVMTLTSAGATATKAQWQAALRAVTYSNSSDNPSVLARTVSYRVTTVQLIPTPSSALLTLRRSTMRRHSMRARLPCLARSTRMLEHPVGAVGTLISSLVDFRRPLRAKSITSPMWTPERSLVSRSPLLTRAWVPWWVLDQQWGGVDAAGHAECGQLASAQR